LWKNPARTNSVNKWNQIKTLMLFMFVFTELFGK
jgi:hypothetical protein